MLKFKFHDLIDCMKVEAVRMKIYVDIEPNCPRQMPACSDVNKRVVIVPEHFIYETKESALMLGHEIAHIVHHDDLFHYASNWQSLRLCEYSADIGSLYYVLGHYIDVYNIRDANDHAVNKFIYNFNARGNQDYLLSDMVQRISTKYMVNPSNAKPIDQIEMLYHFYKRGTIDLNKFESMKYNLLLHV